MSTTVRRLRETEWEAWRELRLRALQDAPDAFTSTHEREAALSDDEWRERTADLANSDERAMFVVQDEDDARLLGCAGVFSDRVGIPLVVAMWVAPKSRRQGRAGELLSAVRAFVQDQGGVALRLYVTTGNDGATRLYRKLGFAETGESFAVEDRPKLVEREMLLLLTREEAGPT